MNVKYCAAAWYFTCKKCGEVIPNPYESEMWAYSDIIGSDFIAKCPECGIVYNVPKNIDNEN